MARNKKYYIFYVFLAVSFFVFSVQIFNVFRSYSDRKLVKFLSDSMHGVPTTGDNSATPLIAEASGPLLKVDNWQDKSEVKTWLDEKDYLTPDDERIYESYSDEMLENLVKNNDLRAIMMLANNQIPTEMDTLTLAEIENCVEKAKFYWWKAAVLGSTVALDRIATFMDRGLDDSDEGRTKALEIMAIYKTIDLLGDSDLSESSMKYFKQSKNLVVTKETQEYIDQRSMLIYNDLLDRRKDLGLGSFDNSMTAAVKRFMGIND